MNDTLYEQLVERKQTTKTTITKLLWLALLVLVLASMLLFGPLSGLVAIILAAIEIIVIFPRMNVEYEYSLLNHDLTIDVIYNKTKRKHVLSVDLKEAEMIAPRTSHELDSYHDFKMRDYSTADAAQTPYAIMCPMNQQMTCILFNPDETMLERMSSFLPRTLKRD